MANLLGNSGLRSQDAQTRKDALRHLIRRLADERGVTMRQLAEATGHSWGRWNILMRDGEPSCIQLSDLVPLTRLLGPGLLEAFVMAEGYRLRRMTQEEKTRSGAFAVIADVQEKSSDTVAFAIRAFADGVLTPGEGAELEKKIDADQRAREELRALKSKQVIDPLEALRGERRGPVSVGSETDSVARRK